MGSFKHAFRVCYVHNPPEQRVSSASIFLWSPDWMASNTGTFGFFLCIVVLAPQKYKYLQPKGDEKLFKLQYRSVSCCRSFLCDSQNMYNALKWSPQLGFDWWDAEEFLSFPLLYLLIMFPLVIHSPWVSVSTLMQSLRDIYFSNFAWSISLFQKQSQPAKW